MITVQRDGYLPLSSGRIGDYKMPPIFSVSSGQTIDSFVFRMTPQGVVTGKVKFDDAEPASNVAIQLYRSYYDRGHHGYATAASARTDDRGEYRVHGLEPGTYYVAALCIKRRRVRRRPAEEQIAHGCTRQSAARAELCGHVFPAGTKRMSGGGAGRRSRRASEVGGIDIFLTLVHTVHVRGRV